MRNLFWFIFPVLFFLIFPGCSSKVNQAKVHGKLVEFFGKVEMKNVSDTSWFVAKKDDTLEIGGMVKTGTGSRATVKFSTGDTLFFAEDSQFEFSGETDLGTQPQGRVQYEIKNNGREVKIYSPQAVTAVLGTIFILDVRKNKSGVALLEGRVVLKSLKTGKFQPLLPKQVILVFESGEFSEVGRFSPTPGVKPIEYSFPALRGKAKPAQEKNNEASTTIKDKPSPQIPSQNSTSSITFPVKQLPNGDATQPTPETPKTEKVGPEFPRDTLLNTEVENSP
ncbi:FecR domain-containing protein [bacterium]|nr:FecR domain-containing protein [bacterium]